MKGSVKVRSAADIAAALGIPAAELEQFVWADAGLARLVLPSRAGQMGFEADAASKVIAAWVKSKRPQ